jgi:hypothetical protein
VCVCVRWLQALIKLRAAPHITVWKRMRLRPCHKAMSALARFVVPGIQDQQRRKCETSKKADCSNSIKGFNCVSVIGEEGELDSKSPSWGTSASAEATWVKGSDSRGSNCLARTTSTRTSTGARTGTSQYFWYWVSRNKWFSEWYEVNSPLRIHAENHQKKQQKLSTAFVSLSHRMISWNY